MYPQGLPSVLEASKKYAVQLRSILDEAELEEKPLRQFILALDDENSLSQYYSLAQKALSRTQNTALKLAQIESIPVPLMQNHEIIINSWQDKTLLIQMIIGSLEQKQYTFLPEYLLQFKQINTRIDETLYLIAEYIREKNKYVANRYGIEGVTNYTSQQVPVGRPTLPIGQYGRVHHPVKHRASVNKNTAALFAFFLGWCGIHRFVMGRYTSGVLYAVFSITGIPAVLALIETFILLTMTDEKYNQKYGYSPKTEEYD